MDIRNGTSSYYVNIKYPRSGFLYLEGEGSLRACFGTSEVDAGTERRAPTAVVPSFEMEAPTLRVCPRRLLRKARNNSQYFFSLRASSQSLDNFCRPFHLDTLEQAHRLLVGCCQGKVEQYGDVHLESAMEC